MLVNGIAACAYVVSPYSSLEYDHAVLVYAQSEEMAREIGAPELNESPEDCKARRAEEHDKRAAQFLGGRVEDDPEYLRDAGWHLEGEATCGCCGLAAMGMEKYAVCRMSNQCKECGCDDEDSEDPPCLHEEGFSCED